MDRRKFLTSAGALGAAGAASVAAAPAAGAQSLWDWWNLFFRPKPAPTPTPVPTPSVSGIPVNITSSGARLGIAAPTWVTANYTDAQLTRFFDYLVGSGCKHLRLDLAWEYVERTRGTYDFAQFDRLYNAARARNITVLPILDYTPSWAGATAGLYHSAPGTQNLTAWKNYVTACVNRYPAITAWEIWNEQNLTQFWGPTTNAASYVPWLQAAYQAIKAIKPGTQSTVITGGLAPVGKSDTTGNTYGVKYATDLYAAGAKNYFDAFGYHPYNCPEDPTNPNRWGVSTVEDGWSQALAIRNIMVANGDSAKKMWMTETGYATAGQIWTVTEAQQSTMTAHTISLMMGQSWIERVYLYTLMDKGMGADREDHFGLIALNSNGTVRPKPVYASVKTMNGA